MHQTQRGPEGARFPELPRLRALDNQAVDMPMSVSSAASFTSLRSGSSRVLPYHPVGEAIEGPLLKSCPLLLLGPPVRQGMMRA